MVNPSSPPGRAPAGIQQALRRRATLRPGQVPGPGRRQPQPRPPRRSTSWSSLSTSWVPGALGLVLRRLAYPWLLGAVRPQRHLRPGRRAAPSRARSTWATTWWSTTSWCSTPRATTNAGIRIGDGVFLGRGTILSCKDGDIVLGDHVNIGFHSEIFSGSRVTVGRLRPVRGLHVPGRRRPRVRAGGRAGDRAGAHVAAASRSARTSGWARAPR